MEKAPNPSKALAYSAWGEKYLFHQGQTELYYNRTKPEYNCVVDLVDKNVCFDDGFIVEYMLDILPDGEGDTMRDFFGWLPDVIVTEEPLPKIIEAFDVCNFYDLYTKESFPKKWAK